ncbi:MAG: hypothetical protein J6K20_12550, partial [Thermoguttaceae bacterium]|nr:hypothetical protein [Thermoguttaceae bacterium]
MKRVVGAALLFAAALLAAPLEQAQGAWCGAASYRWCRPRACEFTTQSCTVMKTCRKVVYEQEQVVCYRTSFQKVPVTRRVLCTKYVPETRVREVQYTVCRPVWENRQKTVARTVNRTVWQNCQKQVPYTVCKPVYEQRQRQYTVCKPVWETRQKQVPYTVCKPVYEQRQRQYTVCKPVWQTCQKQVPYTVCKPV